MYLVKSGDYQEQLVVPDFFVSQEALESGVLKSGVLKRGTKYVCTERHCRGRIYSSS